MYALEINNLHKTYSNGVQAVKGINLKVKQGDFFALLGPNGAGKSTTIGIISSLINKSKGEVNIYGNNINDNLIEAKKCMGLVPQEFNFGIFEKIFDIVVNQGGFYGLSRKTAEERAEFYLKKLHLWEKRFNIARSLSGGMKRRLMIARALVHNPKILILDEPTAGVDIEIRRETWEFLKEINQKGTTIILTTHYLEEAEQLCDGIAIIDNGEIVRDTTIKELLKTLQNESAIFDLTTEVNSAPEINFAKTNLIDSKTIELIFPKTYSYNQIFTELTNQGFEVSSMRNKSNRLEELFLSLVGSK